MIRAGPQRQPETGLLGQLGAAGIDDHQRGALAQLLQQQAVDRALLVGPGHVAAPEHHQRAFLVKIGHRVEAAGVHAGDLARGVADVLDRHQVGRAEEVGQPDQGEVLQPLGHPLAESHRPGAVGIPDFHQAGGDRLQRFLPGNRLPSALAAAAGALQRLFQPVGVGQALGRNPALVADVAAVQKAVGIALDLDDLVALNPHQQSAAAVVHAGAVGLDPPGVIGHCCLSIQNVEVHTTSGPENAAEIRRPEKRFHSRPGVGSS